MLKSIARFFALFSIALISLSFIPEAKAHHATQGSYTVVQGSGSFIKPIWCQNAGAPVHDTKWQDVYVGGTPYPIYTPTGSGGVTTSGREYFAVVQFQNDWCSQATVQLRIRSEGYMVVAGQAGGGGSYWDSPTPGMSCSVAASPAIGYNCTVTLAQGAGATVRAMFRVNKSNNTRNTKVFAGTFDPVNGDNWWWRDTHYVQINST